MRGAPWGGSEELWAATADRALAKGWGVLVSVPRWKEVPRRLAELERRGAYVARRRSPFGWSGRLDSMWGRVRPPLGPVAAFRADVVCISQGSTFDLAAEPVLFASFRDTVAGTTPYVVLCHFNEDVPLEPRTLARQSQVFAGAHTVAFVAEGNRRLAEHQLARSIDNARVVRNPVSVSASTVNSWPAEEETRFACVARLEVPLKGHDLLFDVLRRPEWGERAWRLDVFGAGPQERYLRDLAQLMGLEERVRFHGHVADVARIWADHHLLVLPSRAEGAPLALVEAMLCARPAVATDVGGVSEWLVDGESGFLADAPTSASLAAALERAWEQRSRWQEMGGRARARAAELLDPDPGLTLLGLLAEAAGATARG